MFETPQNPVEILKTQLSALMKEQDTLKRLIAETGENIDVELGSAEYVDHGYTIRLREIEPVITEIEKKLKDIDDARSEQRELNI